VASEGSHFDLRQD